MKIKFIQLFFLFLIMLTFIQAVRADPCPGNFIQQLHLILKSKLKSITWLDINENSNVDSCKFNIRFYPCSSSTKNQLRDSIPSSIEQSQNGCYLIQGGLNMREEGYCVAKNINVHCSRRRS
jgi:hypothetical protein